MCVCGAYIYSVDMTARTGAPESGFLLRLGGIVFHLRVCTFRRERAGGV